MAAGITTVLAMIGFGAICVWAYSKRKRADFEEASRLPLDDGDDHHEDPKR
ncbi:cbb3-type cytochrome oxidase subunit 3 [Algiphilus sp.]|uniref:cbb3-type cytochrome oxidase subunit 3 n=1 Tax=Algiphilus sp. TaxID=1872431 RepID=UPI0025C66BDB|nr:cbb3-type cytochrome c oxidase subunit 3 [Algiphilus sp.]MCK5769541.1 cbb3-type cytochrome c oxidase subunit 3 [Algiphilus sp.]